VVVLGSEQQQGRVGVEGFSSVSAQGGRLGLGRERRGSKVGRLDQRAEVLLTRFSGSVKTREGG
jgi:hypothetical protein